MVQIHVERTIAAAPERVFDWLADPANFTSPVASPFGFGAGYVEGSEPGVGAVREVTGLGHTWFREEITAYSAPRSYSYRAVRSFPAVDHEGGTMTFTLCPQGTHVDWVSTYTHPVHAGGKLMEAISSRLLRLSFVAVLSHCARSLEHGRSPTPQ
jgi:uncharacterized protein YndB with AHSA1/START domain